MADFLSEAGKQALLAAVREVEARSAAEVVITIRTHSGRYLHADLLAALLASCGTLAFLLYSPWPVASHFILLDPIVVGLLAGLFSSRTPSVRRWLSSRGLMHEAVEREARATYVDKGVCETRGRTGLLLYVSQLEREAAVVSDRAVSHALGETVFRTRVQALRERIAEGGNALALAAWIRELADPLAAALPRSDDDVNELGDEVHA
jgi:putative membrane protein